MPEPMCGNGVAEADELCDTNDVKGVACEDHMNLYGGGTLKCNASCKAYDFSGCCKLPGVICSVNANCCSNSCKFDLINGNSCN